MTTIFDRPEEFATEALRGFSALHGDLVHLVPGGVVRAAAAPPGKVALVIGGGSGHYPAFAGYVGPGFADAAVAGDVFASPSTEAVARVARLAHHGGGILLGFGNYAGDVLNFSVAAERLRGEGIDVRILPVTDDVASAPADAAHQRRGVAGDVTVFKVVGAAAEAGLTLDAVEAVARRANARTVSFGVAFSGCTLPGRSEPLFDLPPGRMGIGLGIHGEPGIGEAECGTADELAALLVDRLLAEPRPEHAQRAAVLLNGLGRSKWEELFVLWTRVSARLEAANVTAVAPFVGELVTSLDMAGCSLTLTWLDEELERFWLAPTETAALKRGVAAPVVRAPTPDLTTASAAAITPATPEGRVAGRCVAGLMSRLAGCMAESEAEFGRIDAVAGDGDHGQGMARGSAAAAKAAAEALKQGGGAATVLAHAGDAWADRAGGTSGALWGLLLRRWSDELDDKGQPTPAQVAAGAVAALASVKDLGGAQPGDKTLVDAFEPFVQRLEAGVSAGMALADAWRGAAEAAEAAAAATAALSPRLGRARPLAAKSVGHPDPGAVSLARCATIVAEDL